MALSISSEPWGTALSLHRMGQILKVTGETTALLNYDNLRGPSLREGGSHRHPQ